MSSLTDEQRRRLEENRRKALEKRAAAVARAGSNQNNNMCSSNNGGFQGISAPTRPPAPAPPSLNSVVKSGFGPVGHGTGSNAKVFRSAEPAQFAKPQPQPVGSAFSGKPICGSCVLISRERFAVNVGYHQQLISIFRSIEGQNYESETKRWTFPVAKHSDLISAAASLRPAVSIGPLPSYVLRVFRNVTAGVPRSIPEVDLSNIDSTLVRALMKFQIDGVQFGISRKGRCLISDDMGLGKSIQALGIAHHYYTEWPLLIVCPSSMRYAWRDSIWKWLPSVSAGSIFVIETGRDSIEDAKVLITSYDMLPKRTEDFLKCGVVIMEESHHLKNPKTARTKAAIPIMQSCKRLMLLSGTPALSRPIELYSQIAAINKNIFPMINEYGTRYCNGKKNAWGWDFSGSSNMEELQLILEETIMIRRLKSEVLQQLPAKMRKVMVLDPNLVRTKNNKSLKARAAAFMNGKYLKANERRGKLLEYYSETAMAKLQAVAAYLKDLIEDNKKFICFTHHKSMLDGICQMLEDTETRYIRIDGSTSAEDRKTAVDIFQTADTVSVAVLSITAANSGITLTAAKMVVFAELYWNPGILTQAEDRAHRIGQEDSVLVEYLIAGGTADDILWPMVQEKLKVLNSAGLSKDDFSDADATALIQRTSVKQNTLDDYVMMSQGQSQSQHSMHLEVERECKELESDKMLLDQLLDESFN